METNAGTLDGGSPMSRVDFMKWHCCMSLIFLNATCRILEMNMLHVTIFLALISHVTKPYVTCRRNAHVTLSVLRVNGHNAQFSISPFQTTNSTTTKQFKEN